MILLSHGGTSTNNTSIPKTGACIGALALPTLLIWRMPASPGAFVGTYGLPEFYFFLVWDVLCSPGLFGCLGEGAKRGRGQSLQVL